MHILRRWAAGLAIVSIAAFAAAVTPRTAYSGPAVSGTVAAQQSGPWTVGLNPGTMVAVNPGAVVGIDSGNNAVTIAGTPTVSGTVGLVPGTTVGVTGPVTIGNDPANPVPVRDVDAMGELVRVNFIVSFDVGSQGFNQTIYTVPPGKRLVVEHMSGSLGMPSGQKPLQILLASNIPQGSYNDYLIPQLQGDYSGFDFYSINHDTRMYYVAGDVLKIVGFRGSSTGSSSMFGILVGRLVPQ